MVTHRINRVELELEVSAVELGHRLSDRVSALNGRRLPSLLDAVCSEIDDSEHIDRIDTLELDLGTVALANFDDDLLAKLEAALRLALRNRPRRAFDGQQDATSDAESGPTRSSPSLRGRPGDARELLDVYAWTGNLPWWVDAREPELLSLHIRNLLVHAPASWIELLREHVGDRVGLGRLARACDDTLFELIVDRAGGGEALTNLHALARLLAAVGVRNDRWRASLFAGIAASERLEPESVLPIMLRELDAEVLAALVAQIDERPEEIAAPVRDAIAGAVTRARRRATSPIQRERPLEHGDEPATTRAKTEPTRDPAALAEPSTPSNQDATDPLSTDTASTDAAGTNSDPPLPRARPLPTSLARPDEAKLQLARRRALARFDELCIEDAGLVILWPFLERFFTRVELLHRRAFLDEVAQTKAIALLAYLALEDPEPPEPRLAFAKLLCGRSPEQPFDFEGPLAPELREEGDTLLAAVIDHAPVLDGMPIPQFRASFLQRSAVLAVRTGSWLLQVERKPYDLILDRFSWSWAWVKLPWMPEPLTVEW